MSYVSSFEPSVDVAWLSASPAGGVIDPGASRSVTVTVDTTGLAPGIHRAQVLVRSNDPFNPTVRVPVQVLVPQYQVAVDAGVSRPFTDTAGDTWLADQRYTPGGWGYTTAGERLTTGRATPGPLTNRCRDRPQQSFEYRFDACRTASTRLTTVRGDNGGAPARVPAHRRQTVVDDRNDTSAEVELRRRRAPSRRVTGLSAERPGAEITGLGCRCERPER